MNPIIIVDDNLSNAEVTALILTTEGYAATICRTKAELFLNLAKHPSLLLLDIQLPDGNGKEICEQLKNNAATADIPVILMTATSETAQVAICCGADDFVQKPFDMNELLAKVRRLIRR